MRRWLGLFHALRPGLFHLVFLPFLESGDIFGFVSISGFLYAKWQQTGAYLSIGILALWVSRQQIFHVFSSAFKMDGKYSKSLFVNTNLAEPMLSLIHI